MMMIITRVYVVLLNPSMLESYSLEFWSESYIHLTITWELRMTLQTI